MIRQLANALRISEWTLNRIDPDGLMYVGSVSVWGRWFAAFVCFFQLIYRPRFAFSTYTAYVLLLLILIVVSDFIHHRLVSNRVVTWRWILAFSAIDVTLITAAAIVSSGFSHYFFYLLYYPALAMFAVTFSSFRLNIAWVTMVACVYAATSLIVGQGLDLEAHDDKVLIARIAMMYVVAVPVNLVARFERKRWREAVGRERALQRERIELSQSMYVIGLGIDTAREIAGESSEQLTATLDAMTAQSRYAMWDLRHPIDMGRIFEGRELGRALRSHTETFTTITSVPAELTQSGEEPPMSVEAKGLLFSIAHNALTNAYRHAEASRVSIELEYGRDDLRLSVSDDGVGLPDNYEERGHGFGNMRTDAGRMGCTLIVQSDDRQGGTTVTCIVPYDRIRGESQVVVR